MENLESLDKNLFRFQEVTNLTGIKPYVLRFWETEFEQINPSLSHEGEKLYERDDLETIMQIKNLLFEHKLSIPKAKQLLMKKNLAEVESPRIIEETRPEAEEVQIDNNRASFSEEDLRKLNQAKTSLRNSLAFINIIKNKKN
jgi:DNA-binding transcriptional MerR regulator